MAKERIEELKAELLALFKKEALKKGDFTLSSGKKSTYYLDGRIITLSPAGAYLVASIILKTIEGAGITAVGGPTLGADPVVGAVAALSHIENKPIKAFIVRKAAKSHGAGRQIEGPALNETDKALLIDDVATTGGSLIEAKEALDKLGVRTEKALVIVDRQEGASGNLSRAGLKLESIFTIEELGV